MGHFSKYSNRYEMRDFTRRYEALSSAAVLIGLLSLALPSHAETLFQDGFDSASYSDNALLETGSNQIPDGIWSLRNKGQGTATTTKAEALSPSRSLALDCPEKGDQAQVVARLTKRGQEASCALAITAKLAFSMPEPDTDAVIAVRSVGEANLATIRIHSGGAARVFFANGAANLGNISPDIWYQLVVSLPANPGSAENSDYSVTLLDAKDHTEINTVTGPLGDSKGPSEYRYLTIYQENTQKGSQTSYWDDILIESAP